MISATVKVPGGVLSALRPNCVLDCRFVEGYRAGRAKEAGRPRPRDLHVVAPNQALVRKMVARAVGNHAYAISHGARMWDLTLVLMPDFEADDDAGIFLVKPVLDGICDAVLWTKDRRRIRYVRATVARERPEAPALLVRLDEVSDA